MLFIDTADTESIRRWRARGVIDGVTVNPTLLRRAGAVDATAHVRAIAELASPLPVSVQATGVEPERLLADAYRLYGLGGNIVVKVPVVAADGRSNLDLLNRLSSEGRRTNATACFSVGQAYLAAKAGASYVSVFWSRIAEEGGDPAEVVRSSRRLLDAEELPALVIAGSLRRADEIGAAFLAGADVATAPPALLARWADHRYARATVAEFDRDEAERMRGEERSWARPQLLVTDREGVLLEQVAPYVLSLDDASMIDGSAAALAAVSRLGTAVAVATNQSCVGRGLARRELVDDVNDLVRAAVEAPGGEVAAFYVCPHAPSDGCACRKPQPGMILAAMEESRVAPQDTWVIGDHDVDMLAGRAAGCARTVQVLSGRQRERSVHADACFPDLSAAVAELVGPMEASPAAPHVGG